MLKKIVSLFFRPVRKEENILPAPVRCYQPKLPFDWDRD